MAVMKEPIFPHQGSRSSHSFTLLRRPPSLCIWRQVMSLEPHSSHAPLLQKTVKTKLNVPYSIQSSSLRTVSGRVMRSHRITLSHHRKTEISVMSCHLCCLRLAEVVAVQSTLVHSLMLGLPRIQHPASNIPITLLRILIPHPISAIRTPPPSVHTQ